MGHRPLVAGLAASVAAGVGLWCARASLDVFSGPAGETRVAMFPSLADVAGLSALVVLLALLGRAALGRALGGPNWRRRLLYPPADLLVPLFASLLLALPYLPYLPDWLPGLRALAGPLRVLLWAVIAGQIAWSAWDVLSAARGWRMRPHPWQPIVVFAAGVVVIGGAASRLAGSPISPGGDEPHYLVITHSIVHDGDLRIEDDQAELRGTLGVPPKPDYRARGADGAIYSVHPIGLPVLAAPAYAAGGYGAVVALLVAITALAGTLAWGAARAITGSSAAATTAWLAVALSTPVVTLGFRVYPEVCAALLVLAAVAWRSTEPHAPAWIWIARGIAVAALPWLSTQYAPMSLAIVGVLAVRAWPHRTALASVAMPWAASVAGWLAFFRTIWGSPWPTAPYGAAHETRLVHAIAGVPALWLDQEYGVLVYAPAVVFGFAGLGVMWGRGGRTRRLAAELTIVLAALVVTVGSHYTWWGGSAPPGRQVVAGLLLLVVPLAAWAHAVQTSPMHRAVLRLLVLASLSITATMVVASDGLLLTNDRDGVSDLLAWLAPGGELARALPSFVVDRNNPGVLVGSLACWAVLLAIAAAIVRAVPARLPGAAALLATTIAALAAAIAASAVPLVARGTRVVEPLGARAEIDMLGRYDATRRPVAVVYDPWRRVSPADVPPLFVFEGRQGLRRAPQPLRVLLNTRLAVPAGSYDLQIRPRPGHTLDGEIGLQVGRVGPPLATWQVQQPGGQPWSTSFVVDVDASFVGLRASPAFEEQVAELSVRPRRIVDAGARPHVPVVLAAARYGQVSVYFHGDEVYPERTGFWVRGQSTLAATFVVPRADEGEGLRLRMHGGPRPNRVRFDARLWSTEVGLEPGELRDVTVPLMPGWRVLPLRMTTMAGFVPAEVSGGADRRRLGCWIEVLQ